MGYSIASVDRPRDYVRTFRGRLALFVIYYSIGPKKPIEQILSFSLAQAGNIALFIHVAFHMHLLYFTFVLKSI